METFKDSTRPHGRWIYDQATDLENDLPESFEIDMNRPKEDHSRFYPRMIRSYDDVWSRDPEHAEYSSPIPYFLHQYIRHYKTNRVQHEEFQFQPPSSEDGLDDSFNLFMNAYRVISRVIDNVIDPAKEPELPHPSEELASNPELQAALWGVEFPPEVIDFLSSPSDNSEYHSFIELLNVLNIAKYMNDNMAFTLVITKSEDHAFDMFDALNTTGEPLTAYQTFKPKVVNAEGLENYRGSPSYEKLNLVERYLERYENPGVYQEATKELLISFAVAETGFKLSKKLNDQRRYLRDEFDDLDSKEEKRNFVDHLSHVAEFRNQFWDHEDGNSSSVLSRLDNDPSAHLCLEFLRDLKHKVTIGPISRFYLTSGSSKKSSEDKPNDLNQALRATTAFSLLWRASRRSTERIDTHYRNIMSEGIPDLEIPPMARRPSGSSVAGTVDTENYQECLRYILRNKGSIDSKEDWVKAVQRIPFSNMKTVARFLLLAASHDSEPDQDNPGLIKRAREGYLPLLNSSAWRDESLSTVEHIAPQNGDWDESIYEDPDIVHKLGNLVLLSRLENSGLLRDRLWKEMRILYSLLATTDDTTFGELVEDANQEGISLSESDLQILDEARYLPMCDALARYPNAWTRNIIDARTQRLAELAWDNIAEWLFS